MHNSLPLDIVLEIIQFSVWVISICPETSQPDLAKDVFHEGLSSACKSFRALYMPEWSRHLTLHEAKDWKSAIAYGFAYHTR